MVPSQPVILFHTRVARSSGRGCLLGEIWLVQISFEDDQVVLMILGLKMDEEEIKTGREWHRVIVVKVGIYLSSNVYTGRHLMSGVTKVLAVAYCSKQTLI